MKLKKVFSFFIPPDSWKLPVIVSLGTLTGLFLLIFHISNASSYLSDDPKTCMNCHVMTSQYATWQHSSHARVTTCNDCHVPHNNFISKYLFKAKDGMRHAAIFTLRLEPQVIRIKEAGINVVQENCIRCHEHLVQKVALKDEVTVTKREHGEGRYCWDCHRETPHGRVSSLSSNPAARVPQLDPIIPKWLEIYNKSNNNK